MWIGATLLLVYWVWTGFKQIPFGLPLPQQPAPFTPESAQNIELATVASVQRQQLVAAKLKQRQAIAAFDELTRDLGAWERELAAWQSEGPALLTSEEGRRIAADPTLVKQFRAVYTENRPGSDAIKAARSQAEELIFPIRDSLKNAEDASPPSDYAVTTLRDLLSQARNSREKYRQARESVSVLLAQAPAAGSATPAGSKTLEQALASVTSEEARQRVATIAVAESKAREEATRLVAEAKTKLIQTEAEAEAQRIRDEAAKKKQASDQAAAKTIEEMEIKQKESEREIARLRDIAELRRQGALVSGSVWKGTHTERGALHNMTLTVMSRTKDQIHVEIKLVDARGNLNVGSFSFQGTIKGNSIRLSKAGENAPPEIEATYNPSAQTISGAWVEGSSPFNLKLRQGD